MNFQKIDRWLLFAIIGLVIIGIVMISSVSVHNSARLMSTIHGAEYCLANENSFFNNCNSFYWFRHFFYVFLSIPVFIIGIVMPVNFYKKIALPLYIITFVLLLSLFIGNVGADYGTSRSWINIDFLPSIQPSEIMKLAIIFYLAIWMEKKETTVRTFEHGFLPFVILLTITISPLAFQPDFGSVLVIGMIAVCMFFVAGGSLWQIIAGGLIASLVAWPVILSHEYIQERFLAFLYPEQAALEAGFQIRQSLIAVGSGEIWGLGIGESGQKHGWLPEVQADTIFAATAEEFGFIRILFLLALFVIIAYRGFQIAERSNDRFSKLVATGITAWITFQALINIYVTLALMPLTGLTLPYISYGGSSLLSLMFASGILLHISANQNESQYFYRRRGVGRPYHTGYRHRR